MSNNRRQIKRFPLPDLLKGLAAFFMVQIHITELFLDNAGRESLFGRVSLFLGGPFAAVVFMVVMGYFIAKNKNTTSQNLLRGMKIFILGLLLNIGLNFHLLLKIKFSGWQYNPLEYIFGVDILFLAGMSIIVLSLLKSLNKGQGWVALILLLAVSGLTSVMNEHLTVSYQNYLLPFIAGTYSWSYFPLFPWLAYPLAGFVFALFEEKIKLFFTQQKAIVAVILTSIALTVILFSRQGISTTINLPSYYHHTFRYSLWALGLVLCWLLLLRLLLKKFPGSRLGNFMCWIGKNITLFYVIQWLLIGNIATAIYQTQGIDRYFFWFGGIFTITVLFTFLLEKVNLKLLR